MAGREWAAGDDFSLADCGAAPFLFYADWTHRIDPAFGNVVAYRKRLLARPSFTRAVDEARPYRGLFPLGAPDRDRKSTRLELQSIISISYAVFCLKKQKTTRR